MLMHTSSDFLVPSIDEKLCAYQKDRISQMIRDYLEINQQMDHFHFEYCPKCGQHHPVLVKAGKTKAGKQMLKCNSCKKRFVCDHGQLTYYSHQPQSKWNDLIIETQNGNSQLHTAAKIDVHESTAFRIVTNIFISLKIWSVPYVLHHEIEMDETYVTHCRKGRFIKDHPGKKRGTCASRAGLSDEKVCIITAVQRLGKCIARSLNVSKPSIKKFSFFQVIFVLPYEPQASLRVGGDMNMLVIVFFACVDCSVLQI